MSMQFKMRDDFIQIMVDHEEKISDDKEQNSSNAEDTAEYGDSNWKPLKKSLTNSEILAQALLFFTVGNETTTTTMNFVTYCRKTIFYFHC